MDGGGDWIGVAAHLLVGTGVLIFIVWFFAEARRR